LTPHAINHTIHTLINPNSHKPQAATIPNVDQIAAVKKSHGDRLISVPDFRNYNDFSKVLKELQSI
jgi:hypothetical protein